MKSKQIQQAIRICLGTINKAVKQLPNDKRPLITTRLNQVINKYTKQMPNDDSLLKFKKQLEFNLNFIKLSHPNLDFKPPEQSKEANQKVSQDKSKKEQKKQYKHQFQLVNQDNLQFERLQTKDSFDQQVQRQKNVRQQVQFSNWFAGNVDPQHLKRHKQLLQRQHFGGEYWKDKQRPKSMAKQFLLNALAQKGEGGQMPKKDKVLEDFKPHEIDQKDEVWQKVKR